MILLINEAICTINPKHYLWEESILQLKQLLKVLEPYRKANQQGKSKGIGISNLTKW